MCSRGSSQIIKIVLTMLISGILLGGKGPKTYQLGLWVFFTPERYDKHPYPFPIAFCFEKWNLQGLIIFKPHRYSQSVVICVHQASFLQ